MFHDLTDCVLHFCLDFESNLGHLLPVGFGVERGLCQQCWVLLRSNTELIVEGVMPDLSKE